MLNTSHQFKKTGDDAAKNKAENLKNGYVDRFKKYGIERTRDIEERKARMDSYKAKSAFYNKASSSKDD